MDGRMVGEISGRRVDDGFLGFLWLWSNFPQFLEKLVFKKTPLFHWGSNQATLSKMIRETMTHFMVLVKTLSYDCTYQSYLFFVWFFPFCFFLCKTIKSLCRVSWAQGFSGNIRMKYPWICFSLKKTISLTVISFHSRVCKDRYVVLCARHIATAHANAPSTSTAP